jgi:hypothetical protein
MIVQWGERYVESTAGVSSAQFGDVPSNGWGNGRTGCHTGDAWAIVVPSRAKLKDLSHPRHVIDIAATVCSLLGADTDDLKGRPLLESP